MHSNKKEVGNPNSQFSNILQCTRQSSEPVMNPEPHKVKNDRREHNYAPAPEPKGPNDFFGQQKFQKRQQRRLLASKPTEAVLHSPINPRQMIKSASKALKENSRDFYERRHPDYDASYSKYLTPSFYKSFTLSDRLDYYCRKHKCSHGRRHNIITLNTDNRYSVSCDHDRETLLKSEPSPCGHCGQNKLYPVKRNCACEVTSCTFCKIGLYFYNDRMEQYCQCGQNFIDATGEMEKYVLVNTPTRRSWKLQHQKAFLLELAGKNGNEELLNKKEEYESMFNNDDFPALVVKQGGVSSAMSNTATAVKGLLKTVKDKISGFVYGGAPTLTARLKQFIYGATSSLDLLIHKILDDPITGFAAASLLYEILIEEFTKYTFVKIVQLLALTKHLGFNDYIYWSFLHSMLGGTCVETILLQFGVISEDAKEIILDYLAYRDHELENKKKPVPFSKFAKNAKQRVARSRSSTPDSYDIEADAFGHFTRKERELRKRNGCQQYEDDFESESDNESAATTPKKECEKAEKQAGEEEPGYFRQFYNWVCKMFNIVSNNKMFAFAAVAGFAGNFNKIFTFGRNIFSMFTDGLGFFPSFIRKLFQSTDGGAYLISEMKDKDSQTFKALVAATAVQTLISQEAKQQDVDEARVLARSEASKLRKEMADNGVVLTMQAVKWFQMLDISTNAIYSEKTRRMEPFCIFVAGKPGIGKSACAPSLLSAIYPDKSTEEIWNMTYARSPDSDFWDGYTGQEILYYDDFGQNRSEKDLSEIIQAVSCHNYILNMASIDKTDATSIGIKGTSLRSEVVLCMSNMTEFVPMTLNSSAAVNRRFHLRVQAISEGDKKADFSNMKFRLFGPEINFKSEQAAPLMSLHELQEVICDSFIKHRSRTEKLEKGYDKISFRPSSQQMKALLEVRKQTGIYDKVINFVSNTLIAKFSGAIALTAAAAGIYLICDAYENGIITSMKSHPWTWIATLTAAGFFLKSFYGNYYIKESGTTSTAKPISTVHKEATNPILDKVSNQVVRLTLPGSISVNAVCIGQRDLLTVEHFFHSREGEQGEFLPQGTNIQLVSPLHNSPLTFSFDKERLEVMSSRRHGFKDLVVYRMKNEDMQPCSNILGHFSDTCDTPSESRIATIGYSGLRRTTVVTLSKVLKPRQTVTYDIEPEGQSKTVVVQSTFLHDALTAPGDCGAPTFSLFGDPKIVGIHIAGCDAGAVSTLVPRALVKQAVENLDLKFERIQSVPYFEDKLPSQEVMAQSGLQGVIKLIGEAVEIPTPTKTDIIRSPLYEQLSEHITEPSVLHPQDNRLIDKGKNIILEQVNKYAFQPKRVDEQLLHKIVKSISEDINGYESINPHRILTLHESINGIANYPYMTGINMTSSAGYPFSLQQDLRGEKRKLFSPEQPYTITNNLLEDLVTVRWANLIKGLRTTGIHWLATLKDERRPIEKVRVGKTRLFVAAPLDFVLCNRRLFLSFISHLYQGRHKIFSAVGINKGSLEWDLLINRLKEVSDMGNAGDIGRFDGTVMGQLHAQFALVANKWFKDAEKYQRARRIMLDEMLTAEVQYKGHVIQFLGGEVSGVDLTVEFNSFVMEVYLRLAFAKLAPTQWNDLYYYRKWCRSVIYGDDHIFTVAKHLQDSFDDGKMSAFFEELGIEYTREDKSGGGNYFKKIEDCGFLKNTTGKLLSVYVPIMEEKANLETINWIRKCDDHEQACEDNCNCVLRNAFFNGKSYFNNIRDKILRLRPRYNLITYTTLINQFFNNGYLHDPENYLGFTHNQAPQRETEINDVTLKIAKERLHRVSKIPEMLQVSAQKLTENIRPARVVPTYTPEYIIPLTDEPYPEMESFIYWGAHHEPKQIYNYGNRPELEWQHYDDYVLPHLQRHLFVGKTGFTSDFHLYYDTGYNVTHMIVGLRLMAMAYKEAICKVDDDYTGHDDLVFYMHLAMNILVSANEEVFEDLSTDDYDLYWEEVHERCLTNEHYKVICEIFEPDFCHTLFQECDGIGRLNMEELVLNMKEISNYLVNWREWWEEDHEPMSVMAQSGLEEIMEDILEPVEVVGDLLCAFGLDKPVSGASITPMKEVPYLSTGSDLERIDKMTLNPQSQTMCTPVTFATDKSATNIKTLTTRYSYLTNFSWSTSMKKGDILYSGWVGPMGDLTTPLKPTSNPVTLVSYVTKTFSKWRGGMKMKLMVFTSAFHEGRLSIRYHPCVQVAPTDIPTASSQYMMYLDIRNVGSCFEVIFPFLADTPWKKVWNGVPLSDKSTDNAQRFQDYFSGSFSVAVEVPLKATSAIAPSVDIILWWAAADDYDLAYPLWTNSSLVAHVGESKKPILRVKKQSGEEEHFEENIDSQEIQVENRLGVHLTEQAPPVKIFPKEGHYTHMSKYPQSHLNETDWDLSAMLERNNLVESFDWTSDMTQGTMMKSYDLPGDILRNSLAATPFARFTNINWNKIRMTVELKSSRYMQGAIMAVFIPTQRPMKKLVKPQKFQDIILMQQAIVQAPESGSLKFEIPWLFYKGFLDLANNESLGQFQIWCLSPLLTATGSVPQATIMVYANIIEPSFKIPRPGATSFEDQYKLDQLHKLIDTFERVDDTQALKALVRNVKRQAGPEAAPKDKEPVKKPDPAPKSEKKAAESTAKKNNKESTSNQSNTKLKPAANKPAPSDAGCVPVAPSRGRTYDPPIPHFGEKIIDLRDLLKRYTHLFTLPISVKALEFHQAGIAIPEPEKWPGALGHYAKLFRNYKGPLNFKFVLQAPSNILTRAGISAYVSFSEELGVPELIASMPNTSQAATISAPLSYFSEHQIAEFQIPYTSIMYSSLIGHDMDTVNEYDSEVFAPTQQLCVMIHNYQRETIDLDLVCFMSLGDETHLGTLIQLPFLDVISDATNPKLSRWPDSWNI